MLRETDKRLEATKKQQLAMADVQGEQQLIMAKYQAKAQQAMAAEQGMPAPGEAGAQQDNVGAPGADQLAMQAQQQEMMAQQAQQPMPQGVQMPPIDQMQGSGMPAGPDMGMGAMAGGPPPDPNLGGLPQEAQSALGMESRNNGGVDIQQMAQMYAQQIAQMAPQEQQMALQALNAQSPELAQLVQQLLGQMGQGRSRSRRTTLVLICGLFLSSERLVDNPPSFERWTSLISNTRCLLCGARHRVSHIRAVYKGTPGIEG